MSIEEVIESIRWGQRYENGRWLDTYTADQKLQIENAIRQLYEASETARDVLDKIPLTPFFEFIDSGGPPAALGSMIRFDPADVEEIAFVDATGTVVAATLERVLIHEIIHAVEGLTDEPDVPLDELPLLSDYRGSVVSRTNTIMQEFAESTGDTWHDRVAYESAKNGGLPLGREYSLGEPIDAAFVIDPSVNVSVDLDMSKSGRATKDVIVDVDGANNVFNGGAERDFLWGGAGNDRLIGGLGSDFIRGGGGDDRLIGGESSFWISRLDNDSDSDDLDGGSGNDRLWGGRGDDTLRGGYGEDRLDGQDHDDDLSGGPGRDILRGGMGNDLLAGGAGADRIAGHYGHDILIGGEGRDLMMGGPGDDIFRFYDSDLFDKGNIEEFLDLYLDLIDGFEGVGAPNGDRIDLSQISSDLAFGSKTHGVVISDSEGDMSLVTIYLQRSQDESSTREIGKIHTPDSFHFLIDDGDVVASEYAAEDFIL